MGRRSKRSFRNSRQAITLVEVAVGIGLLSVLLVSVVMASSRIARQIKVTKVRLEAVHALDEMLNRFETRTLDLNGRANGEVVSNPDLVWGAEPIPKSEDRLFGTRLIRIWIKNKRLADGVELASVELVVPDDRLLENALDTR